MFLLLTKIDAEATSWPIMSVFGYDASLYAQVLCGEMSGTKTTAIPTQKRPGKPGRFRIKFQSRA